MHRRQHSFPYTIMRALVPSRSWATAALAMCSGLVLSFSTSLAEVAGQSTAVVQQQLAESPVILTPEQRGDLLMARHQYAEAIDAYQSSPSRSAVLWNKTGIAYHHMFAYDQARKDYEMALSMNPRYAEALNNLAAVYHAKRDYKAAERIYKRALKYRPDSAVAYCNLGTTYFAERKYKQGSKAYVRALALDAGIFDRNQQSLIAEESSREQLQDVNYYLARTYAAAGRMSDSLGFLRKALNAGFRDRKRLMEDEAFLQLRSTPEFHQLLVEEHWMSANRG